MDPFHHFFYLMQKKASSPTIQTLIDEITKSIEYLNKGRCVDIQQAVRLDGATQTRLDLLYRLIEDFRFQQYQNKDSSKKESIENEYKHLLQQYQEFTFR